MSTFLVRYSHFLVFVDQDPRPKCESPVELSVRLDDSALSEEVVSGNWSAGICVGVDPADSRHYKIFPSMGNRAHAGFRQVVGVPVVVRDWIDFLRVAADCGEVFDSGDTLFMDRSAEDTKVLNRKTMESLRSDLGAV